MKNVSQLLLFCCLYFYAPYVEAQRYGKGMVSDEDKQPLSALFHIHSLPDSISLLSGFTDSAGIFYFRIPAKGKAMYLLVKADGYEQQRYALPEDAGDTLHVEIILKTQEKMLKGITVSNSKPLIERKADRTIFNTENSIAAIGADAFELLKKAPGVQVSNNNVGIAGKSSVSVMINDRLTQVSGEELEALLRGIPASSVAKIEVITTPPAKYDAEGNSGIINIVTKKQSKNGFNGNIALSYEQRTRGSQEFQSNYNYRQGKLNIYGTANANRYRFVSQQQTNTEYPEQQQYQSLDQDNRPLYTWSQAGADYNLSEKSVIGLLYTHGTMNVGRDEHILTNVMSLPDHVQDSAMRTNAYATDHAARDVFNLNYEWTIDTSGRKISANLDYFTRYNDKTRDFTTDNFYHDGTPTPAHSDNRTSGKVNIDITTARLDIELPYHGTKWSFGAKASSIHNRSSNVFTYLQGATYINDTGKTNTFDYTESTQASYASVARTFGKWNLQFGLRAEYTQTLGISMNLSQETRNDYLKVFPTAYAQWAVNERHSINVNYARRINRPSFWNMNPFRVYSTATAYDVGNPFLQPSFGHNMELGYSYRSLLVLTAFVQKTDAFATRVSQIDTVLNSFYFTQANAGNEQQYGLTAALNIEPFSWWSCNVQLFGNYTVFSSSFYGSQAVKYGRPAFSLETGNVFTLNAGKTLLAEINLDYYGRSQDNFDLHYSYYNLNLGVKALFFRKNLTLALNVDDVARSDRWRVLNQYNHTYQEGYFDARCVNVTVSWRFGNQAVKAKRARNTSLEEIRRSN